MLVRKLIPVSGRGQLTELSVRAVYYPLLA
jgi:hypothetical protein